MTRAVNHSPPPEAINSRSKSRVARFESRSPGGWSSLSRRRATFDGRLGVQILRRRRRRSFGIYAGDPLIGAGTVVGRSAAARPEDDRVTLVVVVVVASSALARGTLAINCRRTTGLSRDGMGAHCRRASDGRPTDRSAIWSPHARQASSSKRSSNGQRIAVLSSS